MSTAISILTPVFLGLACVGYGSVLIRLLDGSAVARSGVEHLSLGFILGAGFWGWLLFFAGVFGALQPLIVWVLAAPGVIALGVPQYRRRLAGMRNALSRPWTRQAVVSMILLAAVLLMDLLEGASPPADGDTLAYHAAIPKYFADLGRIEFLPTAITGAIPLLTHLIYTSAYVMGGELGLTLWLMVSGWATALLVYSFAARRIGQDAAVMLAILFLTTPAILFSGGSGHVEVRAAGFVLAACIFFVDSRQPGALKSFVLVGMLAGYFIATKYFGLVFAASLGIVILVTVRRLSPVIIYTVFAVVFGSQWYIWNFIHTGDPVFPSLFALIGAPDSPYWTSEFSRAFAAYYSDAEKVLPTTILSWLLYPVYATFAALPELESTRTGFGFLVAMILPLALWGAIKRRLWEDERFLFLLVAVIFFSIWFFSGTTHRARHLVPVFPLVLIGTFMFAREAAVAHGLHRPFQAIIYLALSIQLSGQVVFSVNYARYTLSGESREAFLERNVAGANAVFWINRNVPPDGKVAYFNRELAYLLDRSSFFMVAYYQMQVEWRPDRVQPVRFVADVTKAGITHFILKPPEQKNGGRQPKLGNFRMLSDLMAAGCLQKQKTFDTTVIPSRTFAAFKKNGIVEQMALYRLVPQYCPK